VSLTIYRFLPRSLLTSVAHPGYVLLEFHTKCFEILNQSFVKMYETLLK